jgi:hypothetical protein
VLGGPAEVIFDHVIVRPLERRREAWLAGLAERIAKLEDEGRLSRDALANNEEFVSTVMQASTIAMKNHQQEKIEALHNAVVNVALGQSPKDSRRELFLRFVDDFTALHLRALKAFKDHDLQTYPHSRIRTSMREIVLRLQELLPDLQAQEGLAEIVTDDLCRNGLLFWNRSGGVTYIQTGMNQVADLGDEFLKFISEGSQDA